VTGAQRRGVVCKRCAGTFEMEASLADRMIAIHSESCPRCPCCEREIKRQIARTLRAYHRFDRRHVQVREMDHHLRLSSTR